LHHASEASGFRSPIEARLAGDQSMMQSSQDPRNAKKNTRTGKRTPERAKKRKGELKKQKTQKNAKTQKHKTIKTFAGPKKTFLSVPLLV
jgi:hypothetical protein